MLEKNHKQKLQLTLKKISIVVLIACLFICGGEELIAQQKKSKPRPAPRKKARVYNPAQTKANAITKLQTSNELSELAKIEPNAFANSESKAYLQLQNEDAFIEFGDVSDVEILKTFLSAEELADFENGDAGEDPDELETEDDIKVNLDDFRSIWLLAIGDYGDNGKTSFGIEKEVLMDIIMQWLGTPYRFGGSSRKAIDCSAFTRAVFFQADSIVLPRTAREQINVGRNVTRNNLEFGDLVFFHTYSRKFASHVGIYLGDNLFAHASSAVGVTISSLNSTFYNNRYIGARRLRDTDLYVYKVQRGNASNIID